MHGELKMDGAIKMHAGTLSVGGFPHEWFG